MQRFLSIALAMCLGMTLALDAHAKRFGGGKSFGNAPSHQTRQATPPANQSQATAPPVACWLQCSWAEPSKAFSSWTS